MDVAISGDRSACLTQELSGGVFLFAVAHGFGRIDDEPVAPLVLRRLRVECERRARGSTFRRPPLHPKALSGLLAGAFRRANEYVYARSAAHEDYVTAACSLTAVLVTSGRAHVCHVGSTAAYLARENRTIALTKDDAFDGAPVSVLVRALGTAQDVQPSLATFSLSEGDAIVLAGRAEQMLVARYSPEQAPAASDRAFASGARFVTGALATALFYTLLCIR